MSWISNHRSELTNISDRIWALAERSFAERQSSKLLADHAEQHGFTVERGVAGLPTAFVASYGAGAPVVGIMGEFDALPGVSQKALPVEEPLQAGGAGHGCGHNLFGTASLGAAVSVKQLLASGDLRGTIRFFGTPAEESVGGKLYMIREGTFEGVDVMLAWHPDSRTMVDTDGYQATVQFFVDFHGKASHAAVDPWNGRSAVDAMELFVHGVNALREHVRPSVRMHYVLQEGGDVPNIVPAHARIWMWARDSRRTGVAELFERLKDVAHGAALMAGVKSEVTLQSGLSEMNFNEAGLKLIQSNLEWLGPIDFSTEEHEFAKAMQRAVGSDPVGLTPEVRPYRPPLPDPPGGSSDVADVSWVVPTMDFFVTMTARRVPWHAWPVVATAGMSIGHEGMLLAAKTMAATAIDLLEDADARSAIRAEFAESTKGANYRPLIPDGPPPLPEDERE